MCVWECEHVHVFNVSSWKQQALSPWWAADNIFAEWSTCVWACVDDKALWMWARSVGDARTLPFICPCPPAQPWALSAFPRLSICTSRSLQARIKLHLWRRYEQQNQRMLEMWTFYRKPGRVRWKEREKQHSSSTDTKRDRQMRKFRLKTLMGREITLQWYVTCVALMQVTEVRNPSQLPIASTFSCTELYQTASPTAARTINSTRYSALHPVSPH